MLNVAISLTYQLFYCFPQMERSSYLHSVLLGALGKSRERETIKELQGSISTLARSLPASEEEQLGLHLRFWMQSLLFLEQRRQSILIVATETSEGCLGKVCSDLEKRERSTRHGHARRARAIDSHDAEQFAATTGRGAIPATDEENQVSRSGENFANKEGTSTVLRKLRCH